MRSRTLISIISLLLILSMVFMTGCGGGTNEPEETTPEITEPINVAVMNGPTGMGMVDLLDNPNYNVEIFQSPTDAVPKILSGEVDIACLPSNMAAVLYQKSEGMVVCVSPMVMGVLSILGNGAEVTDIQDLKGQTIVAAGQGGTPEYALQAVLEANGLTMGEDVQVTWLANHADVNTQLLTTPGTIAMVPEPFASVAQAKGGDAVTKLFDMNELWNDAVGQDFPMGVLVA
ncbi:MAG: ABC transporter substrate-binding protein, partial [Clostridia bacterium]|nr:ABC transporter substrate-binding protein [Clostridia bacterium]